jgi:hypothetical protein
MKPTQRGILAAAFVLSVLVGPSSRSQVNSGSNGSDGAFNPTVNTNIDMGDRPNGIYHFTSINIPGTVTVTFKSNVKNTPAVWLVQGDCTIAGTVDVSGKPPSQGSGGDGGPGGYRGGNGGSNPLYGQGPGGGVGISGNTGATAGAYATPGEANTDCGPKGTNSATYGNIYLVPLLGGSGGGGGGPLGGCGGGGAFLVAASGTITVDGRVLAIGGTYNTQGAACAGGGGSGGAVRLIASKVVGNGEINVSGGWSGYLTAYTGYGGAGRIRIDSPDLNFGGRTSGIATQGYQPIILPSSDESATLSVSTIAGLDIGPTPSGQINVPDAIIAAQQSNPIPVVIRCSNLALNTPITVTVKPATGPAITAACVNTAGTPTASTATVLINIPRGGGLIFATAATAN